MRILKLFIPKQPLLIGDGDMKSSKVSLFDFNDPKNLIALDFVSYDEFMAFHETNYSKLDKLYKDGFDAELSRSTILLGIVVKCGKMMIVKDYFDSLNKSLKYRIFEAGFPKGDVVSAWPPTHPQFLIVGLNLDPENPHEVVGADKENYTHHRVVWINKEGYICGFSLGEEHFRFTDVL
jgi:hypothetical protein